MSTGRSTGDELRLLRSDREITTGRRRASRIVVGIMGLLLVANASMYAVEGGIFGFAGGITGMVLVTLAVYWLLLRTLSQPRTSDLCPQCGDEFLEQPVSGVASEPDAPYCPAAGCEWVGEA